MINIILVLHLIIATFMIVLIIIQKSEGGAMGGGLTGGASVTGMGQARSRATPLTRATTALGICFFATSLGLALLAKPQMSPTSIFEVPDNQPAESQIFLDPELPVIPTQE
tara:strand:+ start:601 stop:933 length:333 start_codon:yes stop_codon:yes gene_type:complete